MYVSAGSSCLQRAGVGSLERAPMNAPHTALDVPGVLRYKGGTVKTLQPDSAS